MGRSPPGGVRNWSGKAKKLRGRGGVGSEEQLSYRGSRIKRSWGEGLSHTARRNQGSEGAELERRAARRYLEVQRADQLLTFVRELTGAGGFAS